MEKVIEDIVEELEDKIESHNRLANLYTRLKEIDKEEQHLVAAMSYTIASQIVRKYGQAQH